MFRLRKALPSIIPYLSERIYCLHFHFYSFSTSLPPASFSSIPIKESSRSHPHDLDHYNIEVQCPELIKLWHPTKNGNLLPSNVSVRSCEKIWWKCTKGPDHEWFASPRSMYNIKTKKITMCPFCDNRKVSVTNSFATLYPKLAAQWHPFLNGDITPSKIMPSSNYNAWWKCENGENHVWKRVVSHRIHPRSPYEDKCPFCCGVDLHSKSLAVCRPDLAKEWDYEKNGNLTPELISKSSAKRVWWVCPNGHHYQSTVYNRGSTHNTGCPICSGSMITKDTSLATFGDLIQFYDFDNNKSNLNEITLIYRF